MRTTWDDLRKLVASIKRGSRGTYQKIGGWGDASERCVMEAAVMGTVRQKDISSSRQLGQRLGISRTGRLREKFPAAYKVTAKCPAACFDRESLQLINLGIHLNDDHEWTREKISEFFLKLADEIYAASPEGQIAANRLEELQNVAQEVLQGSLDKPEIVKEKVEIVEYVKA